MKNKVFKITGIIIGTIIILIIIALLYNYGKYREVDITLSDDYVEYFISHKKDSRKLIDEYTTDVSVCYQNTDGTKSLYVFSKPINYLNSIYGIYVPIDTRIKNVTDSQKRNENYIYTIASNNIKPYYPKEMYKGKGVLIESDMFSYEFYPNENQKTKSQYTEISNFISEDKKVIFYDYKQYGLSFYPSSLGSNIEIDFKKPTNTISFIVPKIEGYELIKQPGGYLTFVNKQGEIFGIIQKPLLKVDDSYSYDADVNFEEDGEFYNVLFGFNGVNKKSKAFISFEVIQDQQPDNALYSNLPDLNNAYLCNYSVIGRSDKYGIGRLMIRFVINSVFHVNDNDVISAKYNIFGLTSSDSVRMNMYPVLEDWCSMLGNWNKNYEYSPNSVSTTEPKGNEYSFNITEIFKEWCKDTTNKLEYYGLLMKSEDEETNSMIFLSNDNSLYYSYTEILLK